MTNGADLGVVDVVRCVLLLALNLAIEFLDCALRVSQLRIDASNIFSRVFENSKESAFHERENKSIYDRIIDINTSRLRFRLCRAC